MNAQKNNPNEATTVVTIDMDSIFDRFEKQDKTNRRLTFAIFACISYIVIKHFNAKEPAKQLKKEIEKMKEKKGE